MWKSEELLWDKNKLLEKKKFIVDPHGLSSYTSVSTQMQHRPSGTRLEQCCCCYFPSLTEESAGLTLCHYDALLSPAVHTLTLYLRFTHTGRNVKRLVFSSLKVELHMLHCAAARPTSILSSKP